MSPEFHGSSTSPSTPRNSGQGAELPQSGSSPLGHIPSSLQPSAIQHSVQSSSKNGLLPPFPADRSLPTPQSMSSIPRHMHAVSPESPSVPLSSRSHSAPHDGSRRLFLPSPASSHSPLPSRSSGQFRQFTPSPGSASLSPIMPARAGDALHETYDANTPLSSPSRNILRDGDLRTPSSPDRQESFPGTPAHPHTMWEVAHVSSSPVTHHLASREPRIERSLLSEDIHTFVGHPRKAPPIIAPLPPPRSHSDDEDYPPPAAPFKYPKHEEPPVLDASHARLPRDLVTFPHVAAGPSRVPEDQVIFDVPQTPTMRQIAKGSQHVVKDQDQVPPDYLKRSKRLRDIADDDIVGREGKRFSPGVGVHTSPNNGRRLRLYQPPTPGSARPVQASPDVLKTPSRVSTAISNRARAWMDTSSPPRPRTKPGNGKKVDKEIKKQKRLAAFQQSGPTRSLDIYEVQGRGRILVSSSAAKSLLILSNPDLNETSTRPPLPPPPPPDWPDNHYPWSYVHTAYTERIHAEADAAHEEGMKWIERFLDRDSDAEDSADETSSRASRSVQGSPQRGKPKRPTTSEHVADARTALFSRHEVRRLTEMQVVEPEVDNQSQSGSAEDDEESDDGIVRCVCGGSEEDRPMVACDRCSIWFHQVCMGIKNSADLDGQEKWYCFDCRKMRTPTPPPQPVFSISSPDTHVRPSLDKPLFQVTPLQRSPGFFPGLDSPSPMRTRDREDRKTTSLLDTPRTPFGRYDHDRDTRMFQTPGFDSFGDSLPPILPFDTPRGGFSLANVPFATPTQPPRKPSGVPVTPRPGGRVGALDDSVMSTSSPLARFARVDDTPAALRLMPLRDGSPTPGAA